ncbi:STIP1 [Symbiodinium natans]|uniref:STIP1 protein n=1 Tax=Symbiodinium natans TaxID=878477 RepID=A0A812GNU1_9DINO|nr:STIP1 [Symbiodinium natans]
MAVTTFDGQFSFKQDSLARLGRRETQKMNADQYAAFQNSPFMQGVRKTEDLCWTFTCDRDEKRKKTDPSFKPVDEDFSAPKAHEFDRCINYYKVLGIDEYSTLEEVKKAYKKLSLVYHPDKTSGLSTDQKEEYAAIFIELKNAYLTLGDNPTRRQYDRERDRDKASYEVNGFKPKTRAQFDASEVLKKLQEMQKPPGKHIDVPLAVKLEKFFYGGHKGIRRNRRVKDFGSFKDEIRVYRVDIPRGAAEPHDVTFRSGGDHHEDTRPDTLCFKMSSKPHAVVERQGQDLVLRSRVGLGLNAKHDPVFHVETPSVAGRHVLVWGKNPFYNDTPSGQGDLRVQVKGEGLTASGSLHFVCRAGIANSPSSNGYAPARSSTRPTVAGDQVLVTVKNMQTDGKLFLRVSKTSTIGEIRSKMMDVLGLPRSATVRMLQHFSGGYTPFSERQQLGSLRTLNCAGTAWSAPELTAARSKQFLQDVVATSENKSFQAKLAAVEKTSPGSEVWAALSDVLPEYGFEPTASNTKEKVSLALQQVQATPGLEGLVEKVKALPSLRSSASKGLAKNGLNGHAHRGGTNGKAVAGRSARDFLHMHGLGPAEGWRRPLPSSPGSKHGHGGLCDAPAMMRRLARREQGDRTCQVVLEPISEPMVLFTKPTCTVTFYTNLGQARSGHGSSLPALPTFAISISSPPCAKKKAQSEWHLLKDSLVPLLKMTAFHMFKACRKIWPRALANVPMSPIDGTPAEATRAMPWKRLGDEAFKRGDFYMGANFYTRCLEDRRELDDCKAEAAVLSNRAACLAKVGHFQASKEDAQLALELYPNWGRAWSRIGLANLKIGQGKEALDAYRKAVAYDPSSSNIDALASVAHQLHSADTDLAHKEKEEGNVAMRGNEFGLAVAHYTAGLAMVPAEVKASVPDGVPPEDEHALLRSVLFSNRASAFSQLKNWRQASDDAQSAVEKKDDFVKARTRFGTALLACGHVEKAYVQFAHALKLESNNVAALKGRQACISLLPLWRTVPARQRFRERFGVDLWRPKGTTKVYAISDVHFDHKCNEEWAHRIDDFDFQEDVLIVAGNLCDTRNALVRALTTLKAKFRRVFYVPGNHELWLNPTEAAKYPDSLAKLLGIMETCDELGVDCFPSAVCEDVFVVPLLSWYTAEFDEKDPFPDPNANFDHQCRWPLDPDTQVWKYMLKLNEAHLQHPYHGSVITFSHFLPSRSLPFASFGRAAKAMGCEDLNDQVKSIRLRNRVHVYGHSSRHFSQFEDGILYVNHYHGTEGGQAERSPLFLIHDGKAIVKREVDIYSGPMRL